VISTARVGIVAVLACLLWFVAAAPLVPAWGLTGAAAVAWCYWLDAHPELRSDDRPD